MPSGAAPLVQKFEAELPASATAANASTIIKAPYAGTVTNVTYAPVAAITGANTNTRAISVVNHAQDGSGANVAATLQFNSGINAAAFDEKTITLSGTASNLVVAQDDVLEIKSTAVGTGLADPGGTVFVEITRD